MASYVEGHEVAARVPVWVSKMLGTWTASGPAKGLSTSGHASKAAALSAVAGLMVEELESLDQPMYLVLHDDGSTQHLIRANGRGILAILIRAGQVACYTHGGWPSTEAAAAEVLEHYGPGTIVRL